LVELKEMITEFALNLGSFLAIIVIEIFVRGRTARADEMIVDFG